MAVKIKAIDLSGFYVDITPLSRAFELPEELKRFTQANWEKNHKGWASSYVAVGEEIHFDQCVAEITASHIRYHDIAGMVEALKIDNLNHVLVRNGYKQVIPGLSVETIAVTSDNKILLPKRSGRVKHAPHLYNAFSGWMSSMNIVGRTDCEKPQYAQDWRLYHPHWQAVKEFQKESCFDGMDFVYAQRPDRFVSGQKDSYNWTLGYIARVNKPAEYAIKKALGIEEFADDRKEHDKLAAVSIEHLEQLIINQAQLQNEDPRTFTSSDERELILLDQVLGSLIIAYQRITGKALRKGIVEKLERADIVFEQLPAEGSYNLLQLR